MSELLKQLFGGFSEGQITVGLVGVLVASLKATEAYFGWQKARALKKAEKDTMPPPSDNEKTSPRFPAPDGDAHLRATVQAQATDIEALKTQLRRLRWEHQSTLDELRQTGEDHARTAAELLEERKRSQALADELHGRRRDARSGFTTLPSTIPPSAGSEEITPIPPIRKLH